MTQFLQLISMGLMEGGLYALLAVSIVLVYKSTQVASLAHGQILAFGAIFLYVFYGAMGLPFIIAILLAFVATGFMGLVIERATMRPLIGQPLFASFLVTFAVFMFFDGVFQLIIKGGSLSIPPFLPKGVLILGGIKVPMGQLSTFIAALVLFGALGILFRYTKIGLGLRASSEDHQLAQSTGISVKQIFTIIWVISSMVACVAGIATASITDIYYTLPQMGIKGLIVALFGGLESIPGALIGGLLLGVLEYVSAGYLDPILGGGVKEVAAYVMLLLILLIRPYGLFGLVRIERI
ncbi:MAG: branched-chain amino acid ABC transporter permease [Deltaproteobacteria bacterium]|nr:branched-chain amino acid ABC transporter permease [Deltaproteobacteria bacterium]MBW1815593.1 branched-chain amino acid ABC transporter permease [Deltaproteobacteria bacterium]MBW2283466.1 branched-chain amino acid ABC transporter permease [Deltaproteobacteria bacterium]